MAHAGRAHCAVHAAGGAKVEATQELASCMVIHCMCVRGWILVSIAGICKLHGHTLYVQVFIHCTCKRVDTCLYSCGWIGLDISFDFEGLILLGLPLRRIKCRLTDQNNSLDLPTSHSCQNIRSYQAASQIASIKS